MVVEQRLRDVLARLNPFLPLDAPEEACRTLDQPACELVFSRPEN